MADLTMYDLATLDEVYRRIHAPAAPFWLPYFDRQINFDTPEILFDKVYGDDRGLAPFVMPNIQGRPQRLAGYTTDRFRPAYVKIKDQVDPTMHIERMPGEAPIVGSMTIDQRRNAVIGELLRRQKVKFDNRNEWLAARAIIDGEVTISGEDYPAVTVDFKRDPSLSYVLAGAARWSQNTGDPMADLKAARLNANVRSGARIATLVFGSTAWDYFTARINLRDLMDIRFRNNAGNDIKINAVGYEGSEFMGVLSNADGSGRYEAYINTAKYLDADTGAEAFYLDQDTVVGVGDVKGVRCFGAIMDAQAGYKPLDYFFKNWVNQDPSVEYLLGQSAPLMVPKNPNSTFSIKVA